MSRASHLLQLHEKHLRVRYKDIKDRKIPLEPEERALAMERKAVWYFNGGGPSCAIWKAKTKSGKLVYGCNTHRAMAIRPTLKGAIGVFPFIKSTA